MNRAEIECILQDAAVVGFTQAAKEHDIGVSTAYKLTYKHPEEWKKIREKMRPLVEAETREMWTLARSLVVKQLEAESKRLEKEGTEPRIKFGELARIMQVCGIQFERFIRMDGLQMTLAEQIAALREAIAKGHQDALDVIKELASQLSLEQIDDVAEHMRKSGVESGEDQEPSP